MNLRHLQVMHIGRTVRIEDPDGAWVIRGVLYGFQTHSDKVPLHMLSQAETGFIPGRQYITVQVGPWSSIALPAESSVAIGGDAIDRKNEF